MKKHIAILLIFVITTAMCFTGCGSSADAEQKVLQLGHVNPGKESDTYMQYANKFKEEIERLSGNTITVEIFSDSQLGTDREVIEGMQMGTVDMSISVNSTLGGFVPEMQVFDLPYLFAQREYAYQTFDNEELMQYFEDKLYDAGLKLLSVGDCGYRSVINNTRPIYEVSDLKGIKIRLPESAVLPATFTALGANPTTMAYAEVVPAVQQGTIDGLELPVPAAYSSGYQDICKYFSFTNHEFVPNPMLMSVATWETFSEEEQGWLEEAAKTAADYERNYIQSIEAEEQAEMEAAGMVFNEVNDINEFVEVARTVYNQFDDEIGKDVMDSVLNFVDTLGE